MTVTRVELDRRNVFACLSAMSLGSTHMPEVLTIATQGADVVTIDVLEAAQRIAGVSFTRAEQRAILTRLNATLGQCLSTLVRRVATMCGRIPSVGPRALTHQSFERREAQAYVHNVIA